MLLEEAKWFGQKMARLKPEAIFPLCDLGSSTAKFRQKIQPWIDEYLFAPARKRGGLVKHLDIKKAPGVDIVGDLTDPVFLKKIAKMKFKSLVCANLLEHLENREEFCRVLTAMLAPGGYLFISCPFKYPFHPDPIDTRFRPGVNQLAELFPGTRLDRGEIVKCETYWQYLGRRPVKLLTTAVRLFLPFYHPSDWLSVITRLPWLFRNFETTCLVLRKVYVLDTVQNILDNIDNEDYNNSNYLC